MDKLVWDRRVHGFVSEKEFRKPEFFPDTDPDEEQNEEDALDEIQHFKKQDQTQN